MSPKLSDRLGKLLALLASDNEGEVLATVRALRAALAAERLDLHDLSAALAGAEIVKATAVSQLAAAPTWSAMTHHERHAWFEAILADRETTDFQRQRLEDVAIRLRLGQHFSPHWTRARLFDELVARVHAKGVRP